MSAFVITRIQVGDYDTWRPISIKIGRGRERRQRCSESSAASTTPTTSSYLLEFASLVPLKIVAPETAGSCWSAVESGGSSTVEVVMRPPSVFVRPLLHEEAVRAEAAVGDAPSTRAPRQRASVLLASNVRMPVPRIAEMWRTDPSWVRKVIHEFNERGMDSLRPRLSGRASPPDHD